MCFHHTFSGGLNHVTSPFPFYKDAFCSGVFLIRWSAPPAVVPGLALRGSCHGEGRGDWIPHGGPGLLLPSPKERWSAGVRLSVSGSWCLAPLWFGEMQMGLHSLNKRSARCLRSRCVLTEGCAPHRSGRGHRASQGQAGLLSPLEHVLCQPGVHLCAWRYFSQESVKIDLFNHTQSGFHCRGGTSGKYSTGRQRWGSLLCTWSFAAFPQKSTASCKPKGHSSVWLLSQDLHGNVLRLGTWLCRCSARRGPASIRAAFVTPKLPTEHERAL